MDKKMLFISLIVVGLLGGLAIVHGQNNISTDDNHDDQNSMGHMMHGHMDGHMSDEMSCGMSVDECSMHN